jgi:hypothetical protein
MGKVLVEGITDARRMLELVVHKAAGAKAVFGGQIE